MKCLKGAKVILKDRIAENLNVYFDEKIRAITKAAPIKALVTLMATLDHILYFIAFLKFAFEFDSRTIFDF